MRATNLDPQRLDDWIALADLRKRRGNTDGWQQAIDKARLLLAAADRYDAACFESVAGNTEVALNLLGEALQERPDDAVWAKDDPDLHWIRHEPRFDEIIRNVEKK